MKKKLVISLLAISALCNVVLIIMYGRNLPDESPIFHPFLINYNVTEESLRRNGYTNIPEDVSLLGKQIDEVLIYYQLNFDCEGDEIEDMKCGNPYVSYRFCSIFFNELDSIKIIKLINSYDADIVGHLKLPKDISSTQYFISDFFVSHRFTKTIFRCQIVEKNNEAGQKNGFELSISKEFPWSEEKIKERRWIFEKTNS